VESRFWLVVESKAIAKREQWNGHKYMNEMTSTMDLN
jgi:hypothetical protein